MDYLRLENGFQDCQAEIFVRKKKKKRGWIDGVMEQVTEGEGEKKKVNNKLMT